MKNYTVIDGDITKATEVVVCHQVNCQGKMNSGVARALRNKYKNLYDEYLYYIKYCREHNIQLLGNIQFVTIQNNEKYIVNMFAQDNYGYDGKQYTSLEAFQECLNKINRYCVGCNIAFPWKIGCVRGGADWDTVLDMILSTLSDVMNIVFYRLDRG